MLHSYRIVKQASFYIEQAVQALHSSELLDYLNVV